MHLVGFIIRIHHDAWSSECQKCGTDWLWLFKSVCLEGMNLLYTGRKHCFLVDRGSYYIPRTLLKCIYIYVCMWQLGLSHITDKADWCPHTISDNKHWYWLNVCFQYFFFNLFWKSNLFLLLLRSMALCTCFVYKHNLVLHVTNMGNTWGYWIFFNSVQCLLEILDQCLINLRYMFSDVPVHFCTDGIFFFSRMG